MNNVEHLIKIHDVSTENEIKSIVDNYISNGYKVLKVEIINRNKIVLYLKK